MGKQPERKAQTPDTRDYRFSDQIGYLLRRAYQRHLAIFQAQACDPQLTAVQFSTLCALKDRGAQSQSELVKSTGVDQATIRGIVDRLKWRGFIALSKDRHDGRKVIIDITASGQEALEQMIPCAARVSELTMQDLNPAERMALLYTLRRISGAEDAT